MVDAPVRRGGRARDLGLQRPARGDGAGTKLTGGGS
jgi:hypothetical protein